MPETRNRDLAAPTRIIDFLSLDPESTFRPVEIARATGLTTKQAATTLLRLSLSGKVERHRGGTNGPGSTEYGLPPIG